MNAPLIDFGKLVQERTQENMKIYAAAYEEGYRAGIAETQRIVAEYMEKLKNL